MDTNGNVYVCDEGNHRIEKFTADGEYLLEWPVDGIYRPNGLVVNSSGQIVVVTIDRLTFFTDIGTKLSEWQPGGHGITVDSEGNIYVARIYPEIKIVKMDPDGTPLLEWGGKGYAPGEFQYPTDIAVDRYGNVYVADALSYRTQKFDPDGNFLAQFQLSGASLAPSGLAVDGDCIYVVMEGADLIVKYSLAGEPLLMWGSSGSGDGEFGTPFKICMSNTDRMYITERTNDRVQVFSTAPVATIPATWGEIKTRY